MRVFCGEWYEAVDKFNEWAKGKALQRDVLIQTNSQYVLTGGGYRHFLTIVVIHPEDKQYDTPEQNPFQTVRPQTAEGTRMEREVMQQ